MELLYKQESYDVLGACFEVYKEKSAGKQVHSSCDWLHISQLSFFEIVYRKIRMVATSFKNGDDGPGCPVQLFFAKTFYFPRGQYN